MSESLDDGHRCPHGPRYAPRGWAVVRTDEDGVQVTLRVQNMPCACPYIMSHLMQNVARAFAVERLKVRRSVARALTDEEERAVREKIPDLVLAELRRWDVTAL